MNLTPGQCELRNELNNLNEPDKFLEFRKQLSKNDIIKKDTVTGFNLVKQIDIHKKEYDYKKYKLISKHTSYIFPSNRIEKFTMCRNNWMDERPFAWQLGDKCDNALIFLHHIHNNTFYRHSSFEPICGKYFVDSGNYYATPGGNHRALAQWVYGGDMYVDSLEIYEPF